MSIYKSAVKISMNRCTSFILLFLFAFSGSSLHAETLIIGGSGSDLGTFKILVSEFKKTRPDVEITILPSMGSSGGMKALKHARIDLALTSRALKQKEISAKIQFKHYASTPMVFAVAKSSKQQNINKDQVLSIFTGEIKHWPDGSVVRPILRPSTDSDTKILLDTLIDCKPCFKKSYQRRGVPVALTDQESADMIASVPGGLGTSTLALLLSENKPLKVLKLNGVVPSAESLERHSYPVYKELFFAYNRQNTKQSLDAFLTFLKTEKALSIFLDTGHLVVR